MSIPDTIHRTADSIDKAAIAGAGAAWLNLLPNVLEIVVLLLTIIWFSFRIWESDTVRGWTGRKEK